MQLPPSRPIPRLWFAAAVALALLAMAAGMVWLIGWTRGG